LLVPTIAERLAEEGFHTIGYSANNLANLHQDVFAEWRQLPWMSWGLKATQDSYDDVWSDIDSREGDIFTYVHLMDVHEPFRVIPEVSLRDFPADYRTFKFAQWINDRANHGENPFTDEQWQKVWQLYRAEVKYVDDRLKFPGDIVIFMADHGQLIGEGERGAWLGHPSKFFLESLLRIPFGVLGLGKSGAKYHQPFNTRFLPDVIMAALGRGDLPVGDDLFWEDFWYDASTFAIKNPECPQETLVLHSTQDLWYQSPTGETTNVIDKVPGPMIQRLLMRMAEARGMATSFQERDEAAEIIEDRLRGLGYLS